MTMTGKTKYNNAPPLRWGFVDILKRHSHSAIFSLKLL